MLVLPKSQPNILSLEQKKHPAKPGWLFGSTDFLFMSLRMDHFYFGSISLTFRLCFTRSWTHSPSSLTQHMLSKEESSKSVNIKNQQTWNQLTVYKILKTSLHLRFTITTSSYRISSFIRLCLIIRSEK